MVTSDEIRAIIGDTVIGLDVSTLENDARFSESGIDSLDHANILLAIEELLGVHFPEEEDVDQWGSIGAVLEYCNNSQ